MVNELEYNITQWAKDNLGSDFEFRENQLEVISRIVSNCISDDGEKNHIIQAPTGSGKSIILIVASCVLAEKYDKKSYLLCSDLSLWKQYSDFVESHEQLKQKIGLIKGTSNYICQKNNKPCTNASCRIAKIAWNTLIDCDASEKIGYGCSSLCPFVKSRNLASKANVTIMPYQMYFKAISGNTCGTFWKHRRLLFCDECHNIPSLLQGAYCPQLKDSNISKLLHIYDYAMSMKDLFATDAYQHELTDMATDIAPTHNILKDILVKLFDSIYSSEKSAINNIVEYSNMISKFNSIAEKISNTLGLAMKTNNYMSNTEYEVYEECEWQQRHERMLDIFLGSVVGDNPEYVVVSPSEHYDDVFDTKTGKMTKKRTKTIDLQYAKEDALSRFFLLDGIDHIIMTSATIGDVKSYTNNLGIDTYKVDDIPSLFDFSDSPIYVLSRWKMSQKHKEANFPFVKKATYELCDRYSNKKGIIQTWTYDLAKKIYDDAPRELQKRMLLYVDAKEKRELIDFHKTSDIPTILIGPTLNEGIDLPGDECRFVVMIKMPYPYLGSKLVKKKADIYDGWYNNETLRTIIQSIGRGVRYDGDWCQTYILDGSFTYFYYQMKSAFPLEMQRRIKFYS